jgi:Cu(I)/Ag(I) efflux system membrane fusion protein
MNYESSAGYAQNNPTEMDMSDNNNNVSSATVSPDKVPSATVNGTVVSVMVAHRMVTIDREAVVKWEREASRVDFIVDEKGDMALFSMNAYVMFTFEIRDGNFIIVSAMAMPKPGSALPVQQNVVNDKGE